MNKKTIVTLIAAVGVVALGIKGKGVLDARKVEVENTPLPSVALVSIPVAKGTLGSIEQVEVFSAKVASVASIALSTKLAGYVEKVLVSEATPVKKGETLLRIDAVELRSNIEALKTTLKMQKSDLAVAKSIHSRNQKLYKVGGLAKEKLELSAVGVEAKVSQYESTKQKIAQLEHQLSYLHIEAPFDGVIDSVLVHEGDFAATGKPLIRMSHTAQKLLFSYAPLKDSPIQKGAEVRSNGKKIGTIKALYPSAQNGLSQAEVALDTPLDYPLGSNLSIEVLTQKAQGCILPANSIVHTKSGSVVMLYKEKKFTPLAVDVLLQNKEHLLVKTCPSSSVAYGNEVKLAQLPAYTNVSIVGENNE